MDDGRELGRGEEAVEAGLVHQVALDELDLLARHGLDTRQRLLGGVVQAVEDDDLEVRIEELEDGVAADVAGAAADADLRLAAL